MNLLKIKNFKRHKYKINIYPNMQHEIKKDYSNLKLLAKNMVTLKHKIIVCLGTYYIIFYYCIYNYEL